MTWNIPNILTVFRLLCAPAVAIAFLALPHPISDWVALILFGGASLTDWFDGFLARKWNQMSKFGTMLDPIADKAMVITAIAVLAMNFGPSPLIIVPAVFILLRETFVSGLREFLGETAGLLKVTKLAKWKTTTQMVAIAVLFSYGLFAHYLGMGTFGMDGATMSAILAGEISDETGLRLSFYGAMLSYNGGIILLWIAAVLTVITGIDYLRKAMPFLTEDA
ncbi:CDP-diacylglycerol--glycerol-3-phosphate 3-phosphatidyltransferase [Pacificibacter marinus]|jgi:CDP-diacylglycerol--glycerol-3-phosphate 3-phosphatidyltransferase|uniref:CDP-diacylglycerol--glycerol-3-phosphate 3-phosphatidyltransferase n=1 Tax=Pacificibacter marinus TaxID=658057 RepID=A0A1Y5TLZ0_9RHOB|nr:CDP-diacylglycerol--glycerol-3-phosphate 3-phosphatidyltransferase [Pacificibacter marinus]SEL17392.1 CDP-diacylglycerol--glycerol-3-phosphate 3-phosphatidyltransferase [Pacificibacter marinus]SLN63302.1 CDP-diacylglycerol--glycerol-3-phosphate 3-phosphatidyltransferase [Pacificibacter marinus]